MAHEHESNMSAPLPYFRFSLRFCMSPGEVHGPRTAYIPSFNLIESGKGKLITESGTIDLVPGVHIYMAAGNRHAWEADRDDPFVYRIVFFEWNYRERPGVVYPSDFLADDPVIPVKEHIERTPAADAYPRYAFVDDMDEWIRYFTPIHSNYEVYDAARFPGSLRMQGDFLLFMDYVLNRVMQPKTYLDPNVRKFIKAVADSDPALLRGNLGDWTAASGISRSHFHQLFKAHTGVTPHAYLNGQRIRQTFDDLVSESGTITAIAEKHGFDSVHHYTKLFQRTTGLTPGAFRRRNRIR